MTLILKIILYDRPIFYQTVVQTKLINHSDYRSKRGSSTISLRKSYTDGYNNKSILVVSSESLLINYLSLHITLYAR